MSESVPEKLPPLREVIGRHGLNARKSLGQNFLLDQNITDKICRMAGPIAQRPVIEVGPGPGGLTRSLLAAGARPVVAIEKDRRCLSALAELQSFYCDQRLVLHESDALDMDPDRLGLQGPFYIVANLPYNIATPLLLKWLESIADHPGRIAGMTLMFQKEVAQRICAPPGTRAYSRLSVMSQWLCRTRICFDVPAAAFTPSPRIVSSVVHMAPHDENMMQNPSFAAMEDIVRRAFAQRRKMLRTTLRPHIDLLEEIGIETSRRAQELEIPDYIRIARSVESQGEDRHA